MSPTLQLCEHNFFLKEIEHVQASSFLDYQILVWFTASVTLTSQQHNFHRAGILCSLLAFDTSNPQAVFPEHI